MTMAPIIQTIIDLFTDPVSITVFIIYGALMLWEALAPARQLPPIKGWWLKGIVAFLVYFVMSSLLPFLWADLLEGRQLIDLSGLGIAAGSVVGLLSYELGVYWWHRTMHASDLLWRTFHQMHHSAERLDAFSAFRFSPLDIIGWTVLFSLSCSFIAGLDPQAVVYVVYITTFLAVFQHSNIRTPQWLGYIVQRPENHSIHHARGVHTGNFADLPLFDMLFGTFRNPRDFAPETGLGLGASERLGDMLLFRDVERHRASDRPVELNIGPVADDLVRERA